MNTGAEVYNSLNPVYGSLIVTATGKGINCVAETVEHELYHLAIYQDLLSHGNDDIDSDGIAHNSEANLTGVKSDPYDPDTFNMGGGYSGYGDNEVRCRKKELDRSIQVYPSKDWTNPGKQTKNVY